MGLDYTGIKEVLVVSLVGQSGENSVVGTDYAVDA
jgi:hypothetical protein